MSREPRGGKGASVKVAECLVGDETGVILFVARNEQGESEEDTLSVPIAPDLIVVRVREPQWTSRARAL